MDKRRAGAIPFLCRGHTMFFIGASPFVFNQSISHGSDAGAATGTWPLSFIDWAKERAAELYFREANKAQYPLHLFSWPLVETSRGFKNLLHIKFLFHGLMRGWKTDFQAPFHIIGAYMKLLLFPRD